MSMNASFWHNTTRSPGYSTNKKSAEVIVIGAGLTGLLTAQALLDEGRDVLILEAREIGAGTSGGTTGKITSQHGLFYHSLIEKFSEKKAGIYAQSNQWAVGEYIRLIRDLNIGCHLRKHSAYVYTDSDPSSLEQEHAAAVKLGLPSSLEPVKFSAHKALCFKGQAQFHPREFMLGLAEKIASQDGGIAEHTRVIDVGEAERCTIQTDNGSYECGHVVFATLFPILDHSLFSMRLEPFQHYGMAFTVEEKEFDGMFVSTDGLSFRYHDDTTLMVIGGEYSMGAPGKDPYGMLDRRAREHFKITKELNRWSAHDLRSPDGVPFIGTYAPTTTKRWTATGFKAWGITHAMIASKIITDGIAGQDNPWAEFYSPWRAKGLLTQVAKQTKTAAARLVKNAPRCSHMGCGMEFNEHDRTYDCPCHGSRFDEDGAVLWGPAVKPFKK